MKPFSQAELRDQVASVLARARSGEQDIRERVVVPVLARVLASAITVRDLGTGGHTQRLIGLSLRLGRELGLSPPVLEALQLGASLHDIGKIGIPDRILLKAGPLDPDERALMQSHALIGDRLLEAVPDLAAARPVVRSHHERWDGSGYPDGTAGSDIPFVARLVSVADAVEAMASVRPYRGALTREKVVRELRAGRGEQWDPEIVDVVLGLLERGEIELGPDGAGVRDAERTAEVSRVTERRSG
jgi:HD-GYP domain-containing protein (c-di-GMP phosphodiesterase class II)